MNYGLGWEHETNVLNFDLQRPQFLAPLYGSDLSPTKKEYKNFAPAAGFAWTFGSTNPTVVRGGAGIFYDTQLGWWRLGERAVLGGSGRQFIGNAAVTNPATGQPFSTAFLNSLAYNYGTFLAQLPALAAQQNAKYPGTGDSPQILLSKQANALGALYPHDFPTSKANHFNVGIQRQLDRDMSVQADFVYRKGEHQTPGGFFGASVDYNRFNAIDGPVIPRARRPRRPTIRPRSARPGRSTSGGRARPPSTRRCSSGSTNASPVATSSRCRTRCKAARAFWTSRRISMTTLRRMARTRRTTTWGSARWWI